MAAHADGVSQQAQKGNALSVCVVCGSSLKRRRRGLPPGSAATLKACTSYCSHELELRKKRAYRKRRYVPKIAAPFLCPGTPHANVPGLLRVLAAPCPDRVVLEWTRQKRCERCKRATRAVETKARWARQRGPRECNTCGSPMPVLTHGDRAGQRCPKCRERRCTKCHETLTKAEARRGAGKKCSGCLDEDREAKCAGKGKLSGAAAAAMDYDVIRLIQETHEEGIATYEAWAERVGRSSSDPATGRQWTRVKKRLRDVGYQVETVTCAESVDGHVIHRFGVKTKPPGGSMDTELQRAVLTIRRAGTDQVAASNSSNRPLRNSFVIRLL